MTEPSGQERPVEAPAAVALCASSRAAQGLPPKITDPVVLARVAAALRDPAPSSPRGRSERAEAGAAALGYCLLLLVGLVLVGLAVGEFVAAVAPAGAAL